MKGDVIYRIFTSILLTTISLTFLRCDSGENKLPRKDDNSSTPSLINRLPYSLEERFNGIYFEKFDSTIKDEKRFNYDNRIYREEAEFLFTYHVIDSKGVKYLLSDEKNDDNNSWSLTHPSETDKKTIDKLLLRVLPGLGTFKRFPDYSQTVVEYSLVRNDGKKLSVSCTGVVENEKNVWIHPPRMKNFRILEFNPFPYIKRPYIIGNKWDWSLEIGSQWCPKNIEKWSGNINNIMDYEITDTVMLKTGLGKIPCYKIVATASSKIGKTLLTSYFNSEFGFVKLDYINIDGTQVIFQLDQIILKPIYKVNYN